MAIGSLAVECKYRVVFCFYFIMTIHNITRGAPLALLVECRTLDRKVAGSNHTRGAVLCP